MQTKDPKWKQFEKECVKFLNEEFGKFNVKFKLTGESDSTVSDILVLSNSDNNLFSIECKSHPAQSGQFVLLTENNKFIFSHRNKSKLDDFSKSIIDYMNSNFEEFKDVSTSSIKIDLPSKIFNGWIQSHYKELNTKFIITHNNVGKKIIFPIEKLASYFTISANFRVKVSGSRPLPIKDVDTINHYLHSSFGDDFIGLTKSDKHHIVNLKSHKFDKSIKFMIGEDGYQIANDTNIITKLGKTQNPNVIFSLSYTKFEDSRDMELFINTLSSI